MNDPTPADRPHYLGRIIYEPSATCGRCETTRMGLRRDQPLQELLREGWKHTRRWGLICRRCAEDIAT